MLHDPIKGQEFIEHVKQSVSSWFPQKGISFLELTFRAPEILLLSLEIQFRILEIRFHYLDMSFRPLIFHPLLDDIENM